MYSYHRKNKYYYYVVDVAAIWMNMIGPKFNARTFRHEAPV